MMVTADSDTPPLVTTVTRKMFRPRLDGRWVDAAGCLPAPVQVAMMTLGEPMDRETFMAHVRLGNDGVSMKDGRVQDYFEPEDIMLDLMDLWSRDCTFHTVQHVEVIWDKRESEDGRQPAPV